MFVDSFSREGCIPSFKTLIKALDNRQLYGKWFEQQGSNTFDIGENIKATFYGEMKWNPPEMDYMNSSVDRLRFYGTDSNGYTLWSFDINNIYKSLGEVLEATGSGYKNAANFFLGQSEVIWGRDTSIKGSKMDDYLILDIGAFPDCFLVSNPPSKCRANCNNSGTKLTVNGGRGEDVIVFGGKNKKVKGGRGLDEFWMEFHSVPWLDDYNYYENDQPVSRIVDAASGEKIYVEMFDRLTGVNITQKKKKVIVKLDDGTPYLEIMAKKLVNYGHVNTNIDAPPNELFYSETVKELHELDEPGEFIFMQVK